MGKKIMTIVVKPLKKRIPIPPTGGPQTSKKGKRGYDRRDNRRIITEALNNASVFFCYTYIRIFFEIV